MDKARARLRSPTRYIGSGQALMDQSAFGLRRSAEFLKHEPTLTSGPEKLSTSAGCLWE
jgi:hypothetical protein